MRSTVQIAATFEGHDESHELYIHEAASRARDELLAAGAEDVTIQVGSTTREPQQDSLAQLLGGGGAPQQAPQAPPRDLEDGQANGQYL